MLNFLPKPKPAEETTEPDSDQPEALLFLDAASLQLRHENARLQCRLKDEDEWLDATPVRLFPYSLPEEWIALEGPESKEIGVLETLAGMPEENRKLLLCELDRRYLAPRIVRLLSCKQRFDVFHWTAETTRGKISFLTRGLRDQLQQPLAGHFTFTDVEGNRYEIVNLAALDPLSRRMLEEQM